VVFTVQLNKEKDAIEILLDKQGLETLKEIVNKNWHDPISKGANLSQSKSTCQNQQILFLSHNENYMETITALAHLELFAGENMREQPFHNSYRPLFRFPGETNRTSGSITLIDRTEFKPGESANVEITFLQGHVHEDDLVEGRAFTFSEGLTELGKGHIIKRIA